MQLFTESTIEFNADDEPLVNELSVHGHSSPLLIEIRDTQLRIESSKPFYVVCRKTCLVVNYLPTLVPRLTPLYSGYHEEGQPEENDVVHYDKETGDVDESGWCHNWFDKDVVDWREKQIAFLEINHDRSRKKRFRSQYRLDNPDYELPLGLRRRQKGQTPEDLAFEEAERLFLQASEEAMKEAIKEDIRFMDEWLRDVYPSARERLEKEIASHKQDFVDRALKDTVWSFSGVSPTFQFLNVHGDPFTVDVYNRTLGVKRMRTNHGSSILAPYEHLHMEKSETKFTAKKSVHPLFVPSISNKVKRGDDDEEDDKELKKRKIAASDQV